MKIIVTGSNSQLALCIKDIIEESKIETKDDEYLFFPHSILDITNIDNIRLIVNKYQPDVIINCAAYTDVDKANEDICSCEEANVDGPKNLAIVCNEKKINLIHISSDYVYEDFEKRIPRTEEFPTLPEQEYGASKLFGEDEIKKYIDPEKTSYIIIRTSWLYSIYKKNFMKTMINLINNDKIKEIPVVNDQIGRPTCAHDLASFIVNDIISNRNLDKYGTYNFQNSGDECSWYDFALEINKKIDDNIKILPISTKDYISSKTNYSIVRPKYSVMNLTKIKNAFNSVPNNWKNALYKELNRIFNKL